MKTNSRTGSPTDAHRRISQRRPRLRGFFGADALVAARGGGLDGRGSRFCLDFCPIPGFARQFSKAGERCDKSVFRWLQTESSQLIHPAVPFGEWALSE